MLSCQCSSCSCPWVAGTILKQILPTSHLGCCVRQVQVPYNLPEQLLIFTRRVAGSPGGRWSVRGGTGRTAATCGGRVLPPGLFATRGLAVRTLAELRRELHDKDRHIHTAATFDAQHSTAHAPLCRSVGQEPASVGYTSRDIQPSVLKLLTSACCRLVSLLGFAGLGSDPGMLSCPAHRLTPLPLPSGAARSGSSRFVQAT